MPTTEPPTSTTVEPECDVGAAAAILDDRWNSPGSGAGRAWSAETDGVAFDDRTDSAEGFAAMVGYERATAARPAHRTGDERLALIGWNDLRHAR